MKRQHMMWYAATLIAVAVTALALGAPASTVLLALAVLACPVMMMFMMSAGRGHDTDHDGSHQRNTQLSAAEPTKAKTGYAICASVDSPLRCGQRWSG